jgi:hypothetical protein
MDRSGRSGGGWHWRAVAVALCVVACSLAAGEALAAGGGKPATKLVNVADTRGLKPGLTKWLGDVYNTNLWLYSAVVVGTMVGMGLVLGFGVDRVVSRLGIDLGKLEHHE